MTEAQELRDLIASLLQTFDREALPALAEAVATEDGLQIATESVFNIAVRDGISAQSAMAQYDSEI